MRWNVEIVVRVVHDQLLAQAVLTLAERIDPSTYRRHALTDIQIASLYKGGVNLAAAHRQQLLNPLPGAAHHPILDAHNAPSPVRLHHLSIEQLGKGHPTGLGGGAPLSLALGLYPIAPMRQKGHRVVE